MIRTLFTTLAAAFFLSGACASTDNTGPSPTPVAPPAATPTATDGGFSLDLATWDGGRFSFDDIRGRKHLLVAFWTTWYDPCKAELRDLAAIYDRYRDKVEFVAVSTDTEESMDKVRAFVIENGLPFPVLVDPTKARTASLIPGGDTVPYSILVNKSGAVVSRHTGYEPGDGDRTVRELDALPAD